MLKQDQETLLHILKSRKCPMMLKIGPVLCSPLSEIQFALYVPVNFLWITVQFSWPRWTKDPWHISPSLWNVAFQLYKVPTSSSSATWDPSCHKQVDWTSPWLKKPFSFSTTWDGISSLVSSCRKRCTLLCYGSWYYDQRCCVGFTWRAD